MFAIEHKIWTWYEALGHNIVYDEANQLTKTIDWDAKFSKIFKKYWHFGPTSVGCVRLSKGYPVKTYKQLIDYVAVIALWNREYDMFYRGQAHDFMDTKNKSVIYPSICRPPILSNGKIGKLVRTAVVEQRFKELSRFRRYIANKIPNMVTYTKHSMEKKQRSKYGNIAEYDYSIFQHYGIMPTPLIDITQSLLVATTFALRGTKKGFLYVFGLPYPQGSISHFVDTEIVLVKLQNACPPEAYRPRYQEGYLVGRYPFFPYKSVGDNLAKRMIAKFILDDTDDKFWGKSFRPVPDELLFPEVDEFGDRLKLIHDKYNSTEGPLSQNAAAALPSASANN